MKLKLSRKHVKLLRSFLGSASHKDVIGLGFTTKQDIMLSHIYSTICDQLIAKRGEPISICFDIETREDL